jgi:hypothetical protein
LSAARRLAGRIAARTATAARGQDHASSEERDDLHQGTRRFKFSRVRASATTNNSPLPFFFLFPKCFSAKMRADQRGRGIYIALHSE